jgi:hypothetical protein
VEQQLKTNSASIGGVSFSSSTSSNATRGNEAAPAGPQRSPVSGRVLSAKRGSGGYAGEEIRKGVHPSLAHSPSRWGLGEEDAAAEGDGADCGMGFPRRRGWSAATRLRTLPRRPNDIWRGQAGRIAPSDGGGAQ